MTLSKIIAFNTAAQYVGKGIGLFAGILLTSLLTRRLGVSGYGEYVYFYTIILFANATADWGSTFIGTREASKAGERQNVVFSTLLLLKLLAALFVGGVLFVLTKFLPQFASLKSYYLVGLVIILLLAIKSNLQVVFQTKIELWKLSLVDTFSSVLFLVLVFTLIQNKIELVFLFSLLALSLLTSIIFGYLLLEKRYRMPSRVDLSLGRKLFSESLTMGALLTIFSIYNRLDIILLERFQGTQAVGFYGLSYKIYENLIVGAAFFANSVFPVLASRASDKKLFKKTFQKVLAFLLVGGVASSAIMIVGAPLIVQLIAGEGFVSAVTPLQILCLGLVISYLNHATGYTLIALNKQHLSALFALIALTFNLGANWIFIPKYSFVAAATITVLTELLILILSYATITRTIGRVNVKATLANLNIRKLVRKLRQ